MRYMTTQGGNVLIANINNCDTVHEKIKWNVLIANIYNCDDVHEKTVGNV